MQWYYLDGQRQQIQTDEPVLRQLHTEGKVTGDTMVWNETLTEWQPLSKALPALISPATGTRAPELVTPAAAINPYTPPAAAVAITGSGGNVRAFAAIVAANSGWIRFLGVLFILYGILTAIFIVGIFIIWQGRLLMRTARLASEVEASGSTQGFNEALESMSRFFKISGILALILVIFYGLAIAAGILMPILTMNAPAEP
jgi:hypothetical protein